MCNGVFRSGSENDAHAESKPDDRTDTVILHINEN